MLGTSYPHFKQEVCDHLKTLAPVGAAALDVGAGAGIYADYLNKHYDMDAIEVYAPTYEYLVKSGKYQTVCLLDIREMQEYTTFYDLIIMGDVIEHLTVEEAQEVIALARKNCNHLLVAVPYLYRQGAIGDNTAEIHIQDDLTKELFDERYPNFKLLYGNDDYGYYLWSGDI